MSGAAAVLLAVLACAGCAPARRPDSTREPLPERAGGAAALEEALAAARAGETDLALERLDALLASAPEAAVAREALRWRGHVRTGRGDPEGALADYRAALALAPADAWLHYACGIAASTMGELETACADFTRAIELDPGHFKALQWRGETHLLLGEPAAARDDLTRAVLAIEAASDAALADAGSDRRGALLMTLALRIEALEALGEHAEAEADRARRAALSGSP